jgi:hypothetical protein
MEEEIEHQKVADWLNKKWVGNKQCPICKNNDWQIGPKPVEVREFQGGSLIVGGPVYPLINVTCNICGYTLLINAIIAGFVEKVVKEEKK